ncbi:MAG: ABC transporter permease [Actinomycetota bacterium]|nr:ABC transporter permease [Actinomycetota bacterium]
MKRLRFVGIGLRLATAGGRASWTRLGLMACGFTIGAALLLSAMSIVPALHARDVRQSRLGTVDNRGDAGALLIWGTPQAYGDVTIEGHTVEPRGVAPVPPGLSRVPGPGEIFVSDRLRSLWDGALGTTLEHRVHGHLAGTIAPDGVEGPDEVSMWIGKPSDVPLPRAAAYRVEAFSDLGAASEPLDLGALLLIVAIGSAILLPIWLFVATATRLSAVTREARLAAVRLAGGTEAQVRLFAGLESGVAAAIGTLLGIPLFFAGRPLLASGPIVDIQFYPSDLAPPVALAAAALVVLPVAATAMSLSTMRRLIVSPLGVTRKIRRSHPGWRWTAVLAGGVALLAWCASQHNDLIKAGTVTAGFLVSAALAAAALGLVGTSIWLSWVIAHRLASAVRSVPGMLGLRRLESDPTSIGRVVGGIALMIAMVGVMQSGLIAVEREDYVPLLAPWTDRLPATAILVGFDRPSRSDGAVLREVPGVRSVAWSKEDRNGAVGTRSLTAILTTDGAPDTLEAVRDAVAWDGQADTVAQLRERYDGFDGDIASMRRGIMTITLFLFLVSSATLLLALVDWIMERRRSLAVLSAIGVEPKVVRRSILAQVAVPLATAASLGLVGAVAITALLYTAIEREVHIAYRPLATLTLATIVIVLGVTALSTPWARIARRPDLLREA